MALCKNPDTYPEPCDKRRVFRCNSWKPIKNGLAWERATIFAATVEGLSAAHAYYDAVTHEGMSTTERINRAEHLHNEFDAEAQHLLFAENPQ